MTIILKHKQTLIVTNRFCNTTDSVANLKFVPENINMTGEAEFNVWLRLSAVEGIVVTNKLVANLLYGDDVNGYVWLGVQKKKEEGGNEESVPPIING